MTHTGDSRYGPAGREGGRTRNVPVMNAGLSSPRQRTVASG